MTHNLSRASFLRGGFSGTGKPRIRPPWALAEADFVALCSRCGECLDVCPEKILAKGHGGFPQLDFALGECTFCGRCAKACAHGALRYSAESGPWVLKAGIAPSCLALRQVVCHTCGESCQGGAIRFRMSVGAVARPQVEPAVCTGCGACFGPCPVAAVTIGEIAAEAAA